jgi:hypothetical protein
MPIDSVENFMMLMPNFKSKVKLATAVIDMSMLHTVRYVRDTAVTNCWSRFRIFRWRKQRHRVIVLNNQSHKKRANEVIFNLRHFQNSQFWLDKRKRRGNTT